MTDSRFKVSVEEAAGGGEPATALPPDAMEADGGLAERSESRKLLSNGSAMVVSRLITPVVGWAGSVVTARTLAPDDWGQYSFVFGLLGLMAVVTDLGVGRVVISRLADAGHEAFGAVAGSFITLRVTLGFVGYAVALVYAVVAGLDPRIIAVVALAGLTVTLATPANALLILFQSRLKLVFTAAWDVIAQLAQFGLILVVASVHPTLWAFVLPPIAKEVIVLASRVVSIRRGGLDGRKPTYGSPFSLWIPMLREAIPISIGLALITVLTKIDTVMLERLDSIETVGLYAIGNKFSDVLVLAVAALAVPFTTSLVRSWGSNPALFRVRSRQSITVAAVLGGLAVVGFVPASTGVISQLYGVQFVEGADSARLLVLAAACSGVTMIAMAVLVSAQRLRLFPILAAVGVALNIVLDLVLIPRYSMAGAAFATLVTEALLCLGFLVLVRSTTAGRGVVPWGALVRQLFVVIGITAPAYMLIDVYGIPWLPVAAVACLLHIVLSFASGSVEGDIALPLPRRRGRRPGEDPGRRDVNGEGDEAVEAAQAGAEGREGRSGERTW